MKPLKLLILPSLLLLSPAARSEVLERVVVKVNGEIVTLSDYVARQVSAIQAARVPEARIEAFLRENNARILQEAIDELLLVQRADELGIRIRPDYLDEVIEGIKKENNIPSDEALKQQLRREGMSLDDLKRNIQRSILRRQVIAREVEPKVALSEAELRAEYGRRRAEFTTPATVRLQEILVAEDPDATRVARELVERVRAGEDFAALAREHSASPTRSAGGDLGAIPLSELQQEIRRAAEGLQPGEVSDPILAAGGYRILRLVERGAESTTSFEDARAELRRRLGEARMAEVYDTLVKQLRERAVIDVRVREVPLQVTVPASSILEPPGELPSPDTPKLATPAAPAPAEAPEFEVSPQDAPERVAPGETPPEKKAEEAKPPAR